MRKTLDQMRAEFIAKMSHRLEQPKKHKYNARMRKDEKSGQWGSQLELSVLALYRLEEREGLIEKLRHQHTIKFSEAEISWRLDFSFFRNGEFRFGEAKGKENTDYLLKLRCWRIWGPAPLEIWKGDARKPIHVETIFPKYYVAKGVTLP